MHNFLSFGCFAAYVEKFMLVMHHIKLEHAMLEEAHQAKNIVGPKLVLNMFCHL